MPEPLSPAEREQTLRRVRALATLLDTAWEIPGTTFRIGLDSIVGLIPGVGDALSTVAAIYIAAEARRLGVRRRTLARMAGNIAVDAIVGAIPLAGDLFDAGFKANARNLRLLERDLLKPRR